MSNATTHLYEFFEPTLGKENALGVAYFIEHTIKDEIREDLKKDLRELYRDEKANFKVIVKDELKSELVTREIFNIRMESLEDRVNAKFDNLRGEINAKFSLLNWQMGMIGVLVTIGFAASNPLLLPFLKAALKLP